MVDDSWGCEDFVEVAAPDAAWEAGDGGLQGLNVAFECAVADVEISVRVEAVTLLGCLPVEKTFERDVRDGVIEVDVAKDASRAV
jgi:hypothetical protein